MEIISNIIHSAIVYFWFESYKYEIKFDTSDSTLGNILELSQSKYGSFISSESDPQIKLHPDVFTDGIGIAYVYKYFGTIQNVFFLLSILLDTFRLAASTKNDYDNKTSRNRVTTIANISASWFGSYGGSAAGAAMGSLWYPIVDTIIGCFAGFIGGFSVAYFVTYGINFIGDKFDYDTIEAKCKLCGKTFKVRTYLGEKERNCCVKCDH